ncbi:MAG: hypothetical protein H9W81_13910 [Enterococcus sp.]|nr:hypothetical protein [Enterococcus sp.]
MNTVSVPVELKAPAMDVVFSNPALDLEEKVTMLGQMAKRYFGHEYNVEVLEAAIRDAMSTY